jgi:apolipoprotein N-acyltransferase
VTLLFAAGLGALLPLSFAPFGWWPLGLVSIGGWFWLVTRHGARPARLGYAYGLGKYGAGVSWVYVSIHVYGNASPALAGALVCLFVGGMALFPMLQAWCFGRLSGASAVGNAFLFALVWLAFEWLLTWFLTGFPWLYAGYAHLGTWLAAWAPLGGVLLVGFMVVLSACAAAVALGARRRVACLALALLPWLGGWLAGFQEWVVSGESRSVALVQGNIAQETKWDAGRAAAIVQNYLTLTEPYWGHSLIVWPEAAITLLAHQAGDVLAHLDTRGREAGSSVVAGIPVLERDPDGDYRIYNSALARGRGAGRYDKRRLVPFGDYVPLQDWLRGVIEFFDLPMSNATAGTWRQGPIVIGEHRAAVAICYEIAYPGLMRASAQPADLLLTISNDTWFGRSIGPYQHLEIARMRALENGRWLVRATNSGMTAIVDHTGAVTAEFPSFQEGVLSGSFRLMSGTTPYNRYGDGWLVWSVLAALALVAVQRVRAAG